MSGLWLIDFDDEPDYDGDEWAEHVTEKKDEFEEESLEEIEEEEGEEEND